MFNNKAENIIKTNNTLIKKNNKRKMQYNVLKNSMEMNQSSFDLYVK